MIDYQTLKRIVNKYDPIGLLAMGAPENEYNPEIKSILSHLKKNLTVEETKKIIFEEFKKKFGGSVIVNMDPPFQQIAEEILEEGNKE